MSLLFSVPSVLSVAFYLFGSGRRPGCVISGSIPILIPAEGPPNHNIEDPDPSGINSIVIPAKAGTTINGNAWPCVRF